MVQNQLNYGFTRMNDAVTKTRQDKNRYISILESASLSRLGFSHNVPVQNLNF